MIAAKIVKQRDVTIDIVRSLAIVFMVAANMAVIAIGTPPVWFSLIASLAAPIFITLACMMVVLGSSKNHHLPFVMVKCLFLVVVAILLDLSNQLVPLINIDVLYLIGLLLIFSNLLSRFSYITLALIGISILCITPLLQHYFGYQMTMTYELQRGHLTTELASLLQTIPHRYLVDGWFPLFPWAALCCFSVMIAKLRYQAPQFTSFADKRYVLAAIGLMIVGGCLWYLFPGEHAIRYQYIELFYPAVPGFMLFTMGVVLGLITLVDFIGDVSIFATIHPLGEASLFMYIFHLNVIHYALSPAGPIEFDFNYFAYYLVFIGGMILLGLILRAIRAIPLYKKSPYIIRWIFG